MAIEGIFLQFAVILLVAFIVSYIIRLFNQPIIVGYIIAGVIISPFILGFGGASTEIIDVFSKFGIAFLLFIVGLHLNPKVIKEIGLPSLVIGLIQMALTFGLGFVIALYVVGWDVVASAYVGAALMFSSTIIVMKLLSDRSELDSLHGKIAIGILIIQDLAAIGILIFVSSTGMIDGSTSWGMFALQSLLIGGGLLFATLIVGFFILPFVLKSVAKSQELLFLFSIAWCFLIAALFSFFNFSIEIGALLAGVVLSISPYSTEISAKIRPLRDFFLVLFFIILGLRIQLDNLGNILVNAVLFSLVALIFKPIILSALMAMFGHTKRNNFLVGTTLAQISEFSLILLTLGLSVGHLSKYGIENNEVISTITLTAVITITLSTYMIIYSKKIYNKISSTFLVFEKKSAQRKNEKKKKYDAILFGYNRIGYGILRSLKKIKKNYVVVDFNPETIENLSKLRIPALYGDAYDSDLINDLPLNDVKLVVSTIPDFETNLLLVENIRMINKSAIVILRAHSVKDALDLYDKGASYVLTPHFLGGQYISKMIENSEVRAAEYKEEKERHIEHLKSMIERGIEHPEVEKN